jgi:hypothetical protein
MLGSEPAIHMTENTTEINTHEQMAIALGNPHFCRVYMHGLPNLQCWLRANFQGMEESVANML